MPTVLRIGGYRFFFYSNENDEPRHIHVESGSGEAKFWLDPVVLADSTGYDVPELNRIRWLVNQHADTFRSAWDEYFGS